MKAIINEIIQDFKLNNKFEKLQSYLYFPEFKIGEGTFSISYFGFNELTKEPCIIKIQKNDNIKKCYNSDILGLIHLEKSPYFQIIYIFLMKVIEIFSLKVYLAHFKDFIFFL